ncbi:MAG: MIP/aquaporin family protein [Armatimonadota bacterium]|nr:aquaporin [Fimbriimonadaceae bacterium]
MPRALPMLLMEFIGTFFLVLIIGFAVTAGDATIGILSVGFGLTALVYMGRSVSGAQYNPAVTLALTASGLMSPRRAAAFIVTQVVAAAAAASVVAWAIGKTFTPTPNPSVNPSAAFACEFLFTFALVFLIFHVAVSPRQQPNSYYGFAIGGMVMAGILAVGPISGASFNPAVATGTALVNAAVNRGPLDVLIITAVGPVLGGLAAALVYRVSEPHPELNTNDPG